MFTRPTPSEDRHAFYERIDEHHLAPLWEVLGALVPREPATPCVPALWQYEVVREFLMESGRLISAREAERRVLVLENPGLRGASSITHTLYAGLQLILPGEIAPSHRHTQSALRFVVEGKGAYTGVDGERVAMHPGDFIITPSWTFHDHGNPGSEPVVWLDGLDIPMVAFFDAGFAERYPQDVQPPAKAEGGAVFCYPYARWREKLETLRRSGPCHACHGLKLEYTNPSGGCPMPTIAAFLQLIPAGFDGQPYRATDGTVYCVVEGHGRSQVGDRAFEWGPHDVFVVPSWCKVSHRALEDAVLFSFSDRPVQKAMGVWREQAPT